MELSQLLTYVQVAVGIGLLIFVHELGHFLAARWAGVRVEVFSLGFGKRIWGFRRGGTDYRLCAVPLGGYVKVAGELPLDSMGMGDELCSKPFFHRAFFFSGGVLMNLLLALFLFPLVFSWGVPFEAPRISEPGLGTPAWEAGLRAGDKILRIGSKETYSFDNLRVEVALSDPRGVDLLVADPKGETRTVRVAARYQPGEGIQTIGILPAVQPELNLDAPEPDSPAAKAGLRAGDRILTLNGQKLEALAAMRYLAELELRPAAAPLAISVDRGGETLHLTVMPRPRETPATLGVRALGRTVRGLRTQSDVVRRSGLERGDEIVAIDGKPVFVPGDLRDLLPATGATHLSVLRGQGTVPLDLRIELRTPEEREQFTQGVAVLDAEQPSAVLSVAADSAAALAGLRNGDRVVRLDQRAVKAWDDIYEFISEYRRKDRTDPVAVEVERAGTTPERVTIPVTPRRERAFDHGIVPQPTYATEIYRVSGLLPAVRAGFVCSLDLIKQLVVTLKKITTGDVSPKNLGGIITISRASYQFAKGGWAKFLFFLALLSINLAFINVLPIPILDGGHLMFLVIEKVKGSPVSERTLTYAQLVGMVFIVTLMVYVTYNDLQRTELFTFFRNLFQGMTSLLPWLRLLRIGNGFSPVADILAGACLAQGAVLGAPVLRTAAASLCVYLAGMVWNDVADRDADRVERPERPIPRGDIPVWAASALGVVLFAAALLLAPAPHRLVVAILVVGVLVYDFLAKAADFAGAAVIGVLRALNLGLGVLAGLESGAGDDRVPAHYWPLAAAYFVYIGSLTLLAANEQRTPARARIAVLHLLPIVAHGVVAATAQRIWWALLLVVPYTGAVAQALLRALSGWTEVEARRSVTLLLLGILVFDAAIAAGTGQWLVGAVILAFFPIARWISRRIALT